MYEKEEWFDVLGFEGFYKVSTLGRVRGLDRVSSGKKYKGIILKHYVGPTGYPTVSLCKNGRTATRTIHRIMAESILDRDGKKQTQVNHKNGIRNDNRLNNLEWVTPKQNVQDGWNRGRVKHNQGEKSVTAKLNNRLVRLITELYRSGVKQGVLATKFNVEQGTISRAVNRKTFSNLT